MTACLTCGKSSKLISQILPYCSDCIRGKFETIREYVTEIHKQARTKYQLPALPPNTAGGRRCRYCVNQCQIGLGEVGYCGVRSNGTGKIEGPDTDWAFLEYYHDPLPTNCVAAWVCPGCSKRGFPKYSHFPHPEYGYKNLAVFYEACTFNCLFCQNWHFRERRVKTETAELVKAADPLTSCICFFGGDPSPFISHSLEVAKKILEKKGKIFRICWETNGSVAP